MEARNIFSPPRKTSEAPEQNVAPGGKVTHTNTVGLHRFNLHCATSSPPSHPGGLSGGRKCSHVQTLVQLFFFFFRVVSALTAQHVKEHCEPCLCFEAITPDALAIAGLLFFFSSLRTSSLSSATCLDVLLCQVLRLPLGDSLSPSSSVAVTIQTTGTHS